MYYGHEQPLERALKKICIADFISMKLLNHFAQALLLLFIMTGCCCMGGGTREMSNRIKVPGSEDISRIVIPYAVELEHTQRMMLEDSCVYYNDMLRVVRMDFTCMANLDLREARALIVEVTEGYLKRFNDNIILRSDFGNRPITVENLEIHIKFDSYFNYYIDRGMTAYVILENGIVYYYNGELDEEYTDVWMQRVEPYYKAKLFARLNEEAELPYQETERDIAEKLQTEEGLESNTEF